MKTTPVTANAYQLTRLGFVGGHRQSKVMYTIRGGKIIYSSHSELR